MPLSAATLKRLTDLASKHELKDFEDAWIEVIAEDTSDVGGLLQAIDALESQGHFGQATQLLKLLLDGYVSNGEDDKALTVLRRLAKLGPRNQALRKDYLAVLRRKFADHEGWRSARPPSVSRASCTSAPVPTWSTPRAGESAPCPR